MSNHIPDDGQVKRVPAWMVKYKLVGPYTSFTSHFNKTIYLAEHISNAEGSVAREAVVAHEGQHALQGQQFRLGGIVWSICYGAGIPAMFLMPVFLSLAIAHSWLWLGLFWLAGIITLASRNLRLEAELDAESVELFTRWRLQGFTDNPETLLRFASADRLHVFGRPYWMFGVDSVFVKHAIVERTRRRIKEHLADAR